MLCCPYGDVVAPLPKRWHKASETWRNRRRNKRRNKRRQGSEWMIKDQICCWCARYLPLLMCSYNNGMQANSLLTLCLCQHLTHSTSLTRSLWSLSAISLCDLVCELSPLYIYTYIYICIHTSIYQGLSFGVHRDILCQRCDYFEAMLCGPRFWEAHSSTVKLPADLCSPQQLRLLLVSPN